MKNLFEEEFEQEAITRIQKFAKIADKLGFEVAVGFSAYLPMAQSFVYAIYT